MSPLARHGWLATALLPLALAGCGKEAAPAPSSSRPHRFAYVPRDGSSNGFDDLALAALDAERSVRPGYLQRVYFPPKMRLNVIQQTKEACARTARGLSKNVEFQFAPRGPFEPAPYHNGWRAIGRGFVWRIQEAANRGDFDAAVSNTVLATRFGFALTGGGAMEASLGLATINEARSALAPHLRSLGAAQLNTLSAGLERALNARPPIRITILNEQESMLAAIETVREAFQRNEFTELQTRLQGDGREASAYLRKLRNKDLEEQADYFRGFTEEAIEQARWFATAAEKPAAERKLLSKPRLRDERPWKRFARHFFSVGEPLLAQFDSTIARSKLLVLDTRILAQVKAKRAAPASLGGYATGTTTDPYSGKPFIYKAAGAEYALYSVGPDLRDDGGETDDSFTTPDLTLERPAG